MKEEELLLFKEELSGIKRNRNSLSAFGIFIMVMGVILAVLQTVAEALDVSRGIGTATLLPHVFLVTSIAIAIICFAIAGLVYGRAYQNKLKELKSNDS